MYYINMRYVHKYLYNYNIIKIHNDDDLEWKGSISWYSKIDQ